MATGKSRKWQRAGRGGVSEQNRKHMARQKHKEHMTKTNVIGT